MSRNWFSFGRSSTDESSSSSSSSPPSPSPPSSQPPAVKYRCEDEIRRFCPKRPLTPFNFFVKKEAKKYRPPMNKVMIELADRWRRMSTAEKKTYNDQSKEDRKRFNREKTIFMLKRRQVIKRPVSGYALWTKDYITKNKVPGYNNLMPELVCLAAEKWNAMKLEEKDVWNKQSLELSNEYAETMKKLFNMTVSQRYGKYDARVNFMKPATPDSSSSRGHADDKDDDKDDEDDDDRKDDDDDDDEDDED